MIFICYVNHTHTGQKFRQQYFHTGNNWAAGVSVYLSEISKTLLIPSNMEQYIDSGFSFTFSAFYRCVVVMGKEKKIYRQKKWLIKLSNQTENSQANTQQTFYCHKKHVAIISHLCFNLCQIRPNQYQLILSKFKWNSLEVFFLLFFFQPPMNGVFKHCSGSRRNDFHKIKDLVESQCELKYRMNGVGYRKKKISSNNKDTVVTALQTFLKQNTTSEIWSSPWLFGVP